MPNVLNIEWLNQNSQRAFPFRENSSLVASNDDTFRLPNYIFVDFVLSMPADVSTQVYLASMMVVGEFVSFMFMDGANNLICSLAVKFTQHTTYQGYNIIGSTSQYSDVRGKVVLGDLSKFRDDVVDGTYTFTLESAEFEPCVVRPDLRGVRTITLTDGSIDSEPITGRIKMRAAGNARLTYDAATNAIIFSALSPANGSYNEECDCNDYLVPTPIRTINGIPIEDVEIAGDGKCVEVVKEGNKLIIKNTCSTPCCGCTELEFIKTNTDLVTSNLSRLETYYSRLNERLEQFITNALLSG